MKKLLFAFGAAFAALSLVVSCDPNKDNPTPAPETGDISKVCINEVCGVDGSKAVELYNADTKEVSLEGVALYKDESETATWTGAATDKIAAGGYFVIGAKKGTANITDKINATAKDSFSPGKTLKVELKKGEILLSSFVRGEAPWGAEITEVAYSFGRTTDGGAEWKLTDITIGATNNGAGEHGDIPVLPPLTPRQVDSLALVAVFNAIPEAGWAKPEKKWDVANTPMDEWAGIVLTDGRVTSVKFGTATTGLITTADGWELPADVANLTELTEFRVVNCSLKGDALGVIYNKLPKLSILYLTNNKVTSSLTSAVAAWPELTQLYIDQNPDLGGSIPAEIGQLKKLVNFNISKTAIGGAIPAEIAGLDALQNFMSFTNKLSGELPDVWDQMASLKLIQIYDDNDATKRQMNITGALPASIGRCKTLTSVWLYNLNLTGNIPESWASLPTSVLQVRIMGNRLTGVVPADFQAHAKFASWAGANYQYILPQQEGYGLALYDVAINFTDWGPAQDPKWVDGTRYNEIVVNDFITLSASEVIDEVNTNYNGIWYEGTTSDWRFYQARKGGLTITATGKELVAATLTFGWKNDVVSYAVVNGVKYATGDRIPLSGNSVLLTVAGKDDTVTAAQLRVQNMVIEYK